MRIHKITTPTPRSFSKWFVVGDVDYCCDCGLAHENRYRALIGKKNVIIEMKTRRAVGKTHKRRKQRGLL